MAIHLEMINLIIPIQRIETYYPGGWDGFHAEHHDAIGWQIWHDDHLCREGAMNPMDLEIRLDHWNALGLRGASPRGKKARNADYCVVSTLSREPSKACDWLVITDDGVACHLRGTVPGPLVGPW